MGLVINDGDLRSKEGRRPDGSLILFKVQVLLKDGKSLVVTTDHIDQDEFWIYLSDTFVTAWIPKTNIAYMEVKSV